MENKYGKFMKPDDNIILYRGLDIVDVGYSTFPSKEEHLQILDVNKSKSKYTIHVLSADSKTIIRTILLINAVKSININNYVHLRFDYMPYGRQDRVCREGEAHSLDTISYIFDNLVDEFSCIDPHSDTNGHYFNLSERDYSYLHDTFIDVKNRKYVNLPYTPTKGVVPVSPDTGAVGRTTKFSNELSLHSPVILSKTRTNVGISYTRGSTRWYAGVKRLVVVDDICDGGATFLAVHSLLKETYPNLPIDLVVSHGLFTAGLDKLLNKFDNIYVLNTAYNKKRLKEL